LIFSSALLKRRAARELINERANQSTRNDPLRTRDVKHGLSRSFPPLLWIITSRKKFLKNISVRRVARVVKRQTDELCLAREKTLPSFPRTRESIRVFRFRGTMLLAVARTVHPRNFAAKIPSRASIS
jgi:hypothetical protein